MQRERSCDGLGARAIKSINVGKITATKPTGNVHIRVGQLPVRNVHMCHVHINKIVLCSVSRRFALFVAVFRPLAYRNLQLWPTTRPNASGSRAALTVSVVLAAHFLRNILPKPHVPLHCPKSPDIFTVVVGCTKFAPNPKTGSHCHCHPLNACSSCRVHSSIATRLLL